MSRGESPLTLRQYEALGEVRPKKESKVCVEMVISSSSEKTEVSKGVLWASDQGT